MIDQTLWIERKFNFDFPDGMFPVILERLCGAVPRIKELISGLNDEQLSAKKNDKWSIKEVIGHLYDLENLHDGRIDDFTEGKEILRAADMKNVKTTEANYNSEPVEEIIILFNESRNKFIERLENASAELLIKSALHPRLQKQMRLIDMAFFVCEHDDYEITKMRAIKKSLQ
ncbi:MAG: DinB family protein [Chitinophagales bacterium]|nr:DinB family protein [Chitinophagales bacterium]